MPTVVLFALIVILSVPMATRAVNLPLVVGVAVLFLKLFAVVMESTAVQMDTPVIRQPELVTKKGKLYIC